MRLREAGVSERQMLAILQSRARAAHASQTSLAPVIEGVRRELANGLKERTESRSRRK